MASEKLSKHRNTLTNIFLLLMYRSLFLCFKFPFHMPLHFSQQKEAWGLKKEQFIKTRAEILEQLYRV